MISGALFNAFLVMVVFATYVSYGGVMTVSTTTVATLMIRKIMSPIGRLFMFFYRMFGMNVSLTRVHDFLSAEESQPNVISRHLSSKTGAMALKIRGNYSFGF